MNKNFNPTRRRKSIRMPGFDYAKDGAYFITLVTQDRACLFGTIIAGGMIHNEAGMMVDKVCRELPYNIQGVDIDPYQTMPNHFHAIILFNQTGETDSRVCPGRAHAAPNTVELSKVAPAQGHVSLADVVQRFKSLTTLRYIEGVHQLGWPRFNQHLWQRNYYDHVIRNEGDHQAVVDYILTNPQNWERDDEHQ